MQLTPPPTGVVHLPDLRNAASPATPPSATATAPAIPAPIAAPTPSAPSSDGAWHAGQVHPLWDRPPAVAIGHAFSGLLDSVKGSLMKLRYKPDELAQRQIAAAVEMMRADQAAQAQAATS